MRCRPWSPTARCSRCTPGTTTRWATPAAWSIWPATWKASASEDERVATLFALFADASLACLAAGVTLGTNRQLRAPRRAQLRHRHRRLLGLHAHRRCAAHAGAAALLSAGLLAVHARLPVPALRGGGR